MRSYRVTPVGLELALQPEWTLNFSPFVVYSDLRADRLILLAPPSMTPFETCPSLPPGTPKGSVPSAPASYLHELVALFAGDNEVVPELVLRLQILDDGELIQGLGLGALDDCW